MTTAPALVRDARSGSVGPRTSHESSVLWSLAHEALPAAVMVGAVLAGHGAAAMTGAAVLLALVSFGYAPLARTRHWAREHLVDLWAMLLLMAAMGGMGVGAGSAVDAGRAMSGHGMGGLALGSAGLLGPLGPVAPLGVVVVWIAARVLLARRGWRIHSVVSAAVCGAGLVWMLVL